MIRHMMMYLSCAISLLSGLNYRKVLTVGSELHRITPRIFPRNYNARTSSESCHLLGYIIHTKACRPWYGMPNSWNCNRFLVVKEALQHVAIDISRISYEDK